jgi:hypothetical protein
MTINKSICKVNNNKFRAAVAELMGFRMNFECSKKALLNGNKLYFKMSTQGVDILDNWLPHTSKNELVEVTIIGDNNFYTFLE